MTENINFITPIRADVRVVRTLLENDVPITDMVMRGLWRWFADVEIPVPLPRMGLKDDQRRALALTIITEMDEAFTKLEIACEGKTTEEQAEYTASADATVVNNLWKEIAGCYAEIINEDVTVIPEEMRAEVYANALQSLNKQVLTNLKSAK